MPEKLTVFRFDLGSFDVLMDSGSFTSLSSWLDCKVSGSSGLEDLYNTQLNKNFLVSIKDQEYTGSFLDSMLVGQFDRISESEAVGFTAFMLHSGTAEEHFALFTDRSFDLREYPEKQFCVFPASIAGFMAGRGIRALRYENNKRVQILISPLSPVGFKQ